MPNPYLEMDIRTASPEELVGRLLDRAVLYVRNEIESDGASADDAGIANSIDIVSELRNALDAERGGEVAGNLDALYEFVNRRLLLGRVTGDRGALSDALVVLETLASGWEELLGRRRGQA